MFHPGGQATHLAGDPGEIDRLEAVQLFRFARPVPVEGVYVADSLGETAVVVDDRYRVDPVAAGGFHL